MAYNKKVWVQDEKILAADLNNMEDEIDAMADLAYTFTGAKKYTSNPTVEKVDAGISLKDTDSGGKELVVQSVDGKLQVNEAGVGVAIDDLISHESRHETGGDDALALGSIAGTLGAAQHGTGLGVDKHHPQSHGPADHPDRTHTKFISGGMFIPDYQYGFYQSNGWAGPELRYNVEDAAYAFLNLKDSELYKLSTSRPLYIHLANISGNTGIARMTISVAGIDSPDNNGGTNFFLQTIDIGSFAAYQYRKTTLDNINLSTGYDILGILAIRRGTHGNDTLEGSVALMGLEIVPESDQ